MNQKGQIGIGYDVILRPAHRKVGEEAWEPRVAESFSGARNAEEAVRTTTIMLQRHLADLDDDNLVEVRRDDGTTLFPEPQTVSEFRRLK
jgi:hypothetical protein